MKCDALCSPSANVCDTVVCDVVLNIKSSFFTADHKQKKNILSNHFVIKKFNEESEEITFLTRSLKMFHKYIIFFS